MRRIAANLVEGEIWIIAALIVVILLITPVLPWVTIAAGMFWAMRWIAYERATGMSSLDVSIRLVVAMMGVSVWLAGEAEITLVQVFRLLSGVATYYRVVNWFDV